MALLPFAPNCSTSSRYHLLSSSPSFHCLLLHSRSHLHRHNSDTLSFKISCSHPTVHVETQHHANPKRVPFESFKKKRKPRPSFSDQIRERWSVKITSLREKFPWQEKHEEKNEGKSHREQSVEEKASGLVENEVLESVENYPIDSFIPSQSSSPPWVHGRVKEETLLNSETESWKIYPEVEKNNGLVLELKNREVKEDKKVTTGVRNSNFEFEGVKKSMLGLSDKVELGKDENLGEVSDHRDSLLSELDLVEKGVSRKVEMTAAKQVRCHPPEVKNGVRSSMKYEKRDDKGEKIDFKIEGVESSLFNIEGLLDNVDSGKIENLDKVSVPRDSLLSEVDLIKDVKFQEDRSLTMKEVRSHSVEVPWERGGDFESKDGVERKKRSNTELAEKTIPEHELRRLRNISLRMIERIKVGDAGVTQALVDSIHEKWKVDEVVKLKFEGAHSCNMKRTHQILESKTGGLVIWRSGSSIVLYRGMSYKLPCVQSYSQKVQADPSLQAHLNDAVDGAIHVKSSTVSHSHISDSVKYPKGLSKEELMDMNNLNNLLDELGPRFKDWSGREPLPVDADLLPSFIPGYKTPFRLLPYKVRHCLKNKEMTALRRLARRMPPHFALGRSKKLHGLAKAMVKLWERSAIAKIAIKRSIANTCNERMAEELKMLTGGTLLSRNKEYIVFYRGNDFLPPKVVEVLKEREKMKDIEQNEEEQARQMASTMVGSKLRTSKIPLVAGTLTETVAATSRWATERSSKDVEEMLREESLNKRASLVRYLEKKLALAKRKVRKAERALAKVQEHLKPADIPTDLETITDEERFQFRKIGLSMKPFLLVGRRGVFDGTVENMHLHWKYRELVKLMVRGKSFAQVKHLAISLEAESGGVLVSLDKTPKGYCIIVYRGKNYQRPHQIRPRNLLTRQQALARSIELQRREALKHHILDLQERIGLLKSDLEEMRNNDKEIDDKKTLALYKAHSSIDTIVKDEGEEAYLEVQDIEPEDVANYNDENIVEGHA